MRALAGRDVFLETVVRRPWPLATRPPADEGLTPGSAGQPRGFLKCHLKALGGEERKSIELASCVLPKAQLGPAPALTKPV